MMSTREAGATPAGFGVAGRGAPFDVVVHAAITVGRWIGDRPGVERIQSGRQAQAFKLQDFRG
jgi:phenolic acid decarboxylase